jgi:hypothetical protein
MKTLFVWIFLLFSLGLTVNLNGGGITSGIITGYEEWSDTVKVTGDITIDENGILAILAGTYIEFQDHFKITVTNNGKINASGADSDSIIFTSKDKNAGWNGIRFENMLVSSDSSIFDFCRFEYSKTNESKKGGVFTLKQNTKIRISNCIFTKNRTNNNYGGCIYGDSTNVIIIACRLADNYSGRGAGLYLIDSYASILNSAIVDNETYWSGAGICCTNSRLYIEKCDILNNFHNTSGSGGGISSSESEVELISCKVINNKGNGIYCRLYGKLSVINSLIANNEGGYGGGIECWGTELKIINSTIVKNICSMSNGAGGVYNNSGQTNIINTIIWDNFGDSPQLYYYDHLPVIENCDIHEGFNLGLPEENYINSISEYPRFKNPSEFTGNGADALQAEWDLLMCSPCVDAGINDSLPGNLTKDLMNNPRIFNSIVDIGAFESQIINTGYSGKKVVFVKQDGIGDGTSWNNATGDLQEAINTQLECYDTVEIWVVGGKYYPDTSGYSDPRSASFQLKNNINIYGGFFGIEELLNQRDPETNITVLSGDIGEKLNILDNSYHVVTARYINSSALLDGFQISNGLASKDFDHNDGGGIFCYCASPTLHHLKICNNIAIDHGGGLFLDFSKPLISNCVISNNESNSNGGGGYFDYSKPNIINCIISNNRVFYGFNGGGLSLQDSEPNIINSIIANNESGYKGNGGGIYCSSSNPHIINSLLANNYTDNDGAGIYCQYSSVAELLNSMMWNNMNKSGINHFQSNLSNSGIIKNSIIEGGNQYNIPEAYYINNYDLNPRFINPSTKVGNSNDALISDWTLSSCSPCIDLGSIALLPLEIETDMAGNNRIINDSVDIGPYEYKGVITEILPKNIIYVKQGGNGDGSSWNEALGNLQDAINISKGCYENIEIWVAAGVYKPDTSDLDDHRMASFTLMNNIQILGGFAGNENSIDERDWKQNQTILDGDIGIPDYKEDNCYNVVTSNFNDSTCVLDGVIIKNGYADEFIIGENGGGIYCNYSSSLFKNLVILNNSADYRGGGIYFNKSNSSIINSTINNNIADNGGGIAINESSVKISNCEIINNRGGCCGGAYFFKSGVDVVNCVFSNNQGDDAGGLFSAYCNYSILNSTFANNRASAGGTRVYEDTLTIVNSIYWNNQNNVSIKNFQISDGKVTIMNSDIQNGNDFGLADTCYINNIDNDPMFLNPIKPVGPDTSAMSADWDLKKCSPCINKGINDPYPEEINFDLAGNPRIFNDTIDIGAFEVQAFREYAPHELNLSNDSVYENSDLFTLLGILTAKDLDSDTFKYSFAKGDNFWNPDTSYFKLVQDSLYTNHVFDCEYRKYYNIYIRVTDDQGWYLDKQFTVTIKNINEAPDSLTLSNNLINEDSDSGTFIGIFRGYDRDSEFLVFYFAAGDGTNDLDSSCFSIVKDTLKSNCVFNYDDKSLYYIVIRAADEGGLYVDRPITIEVLDVTGSSLVSDYPWIKIFPNPAGHIINIEIYDPEYHNKSIKLIDLNGKNLITKSIKNQNKVILPINEIETGLYILEIVYEDIIQRFKIILH